MSFWNAFKQEMSSGFVPGEGEAPKKPGVIHQVGQEMSHGFEIPAETRRPDVLTRLGQAVRQESGRAFVQEGDGQPGQLKTALMTELHQGYKNEPKGPGVIRQLVNVASQSAGQQAMGELFNGAQETESAAARRAVAAERVASRRAMVGGVAKRVKEGILNKMTGGATGMLNLIRERRGRNGNGDGTVEEVVETVRPPAQFAAGGFVRELHTPAGLPVQTAEDGVFRVIDGEEG